MLRGVPMDAKSLQRRLERADRQRLALRRATLELREMGRTIRARAERWISPIP